MQPVRTLTLLLAFVSTTFSSEVPPKDRPALGQVSKEEITTLERFIVTASRLENADIRPWRYMYIPGYEIISHCEDPDTYECAQAIVRGNSAMKAIIPNGSLATAIPTTVILYDGVREDDATKSIVPVAGKGSLDEVAWGSYLKGISTIEPEAKAEVEDTMVDCWSLRPFRVDVLGEHTSALPGQIIRSSFGFRLRRRVPQFPNWLISGLLGPNGVYRRGIDFIWSNDVGEPPSMTIPTAQWISNSDTLEVRNNSKSGVSLMPMDKFFAEKDPRKSADSAVWFAQAALFVRWGMFGEADGEKIHPAMFWRFVDEAETGPITENQLIDCFGFGYAELRSRLARYLPVAASHLVKKDIDLDLKPAVPRLRDATESEKGRILGDWERIKGVALRTENPGLSGAFLRQAEKSLFKPYRMGIRDPQLLGVLGLYEHSIGVEDKAREYLEVAVAGHAVRPSFYVELAKMRFNQALGHPKGPGGKLSAEQVADVLGPLFAARTHPPALPTTYRQIAEVWEQSAVPPVAGNLAVLDEGQQLFPLDESLAEATAVLRRQWGVSKGE